MRFVQTNLRETDANALLFGMGGITAYYPTKAGFHYPSPFLPPGHDLFGDVLREAHARGIRVIGRFDLSKTQKAVFKRTLMSSSSTESIWKRGRKLAHADSARALQAESTKPWCTS